MRRSDDPDFVPSLRLLVERERYSFSDIGFMFGVSRERVSQWCRDFNIVHPDDSLGSRGLFCVRVWDDCLNRFIPVHRGLLACATKEKRRSAKKAQREVERRDRRIQLLGTAVDLQDSLGRTPSLGEIFTAFSGVPTAPNVAASLLVSAWGFSQRQSSTECYRELRAALSAVGVKSRPRGSIGHIKPRE